jgi:hypothetical protein
MSQDRSPEWNGHYPRTGVGGIPGQWLGNGGHQDNVFEEAHTFCEWVCKFGNTTELYVVLIDTDLTSQFNELKKKYHKNNLLVVNHVDFQQYMIDKFLFTREP